MRNYTWIDPLSTGEWVWKHKEALAAPDYREAPIVHLLRGWIEAWEILERDGNARRMSAILKSWSDMGSEIVVLCGGCRISRTRLDLSTIASIIGENIRLAQEACQNQEAE